MHQQKASDNELIALYLKGDERGLEDLIYRHKSRIYTSIYLLVKDKDLANDLFQDTFIKVINTLRSGNYQEEGKFLPWVLRIAHNLVIDYFRKEKRMPMVHDELPDDQREVVMMRHYANMSFKEIADIMGCSVNTALGRMRYALLNMRRIIIQKKLVLEK